MLARAVDLSVDCLVARILDGHDHGSRVDCETAFSMGQLTEVEGHVHGDVAVVVVRAVHVVLVGIVPELTVSTGSVVESSTVAADCHREGVVILFVGIGSVVIVRVTGPVPRLVLDLVESGASAAKNLQRLDPVISGERGQVGRLFTRVFTRIISRLGNVDNALVTDDF